jgi:hypothetical protein
MQESGFTRIVSFVADHSPGSPLLAMSLERAPGIALGAIPVPDEPTIDGSPYPSRALVLNPQLMNLPRAAAIEPAILVCTVHPITKGQFLDQEGDEELRI